MSPNTDRIFVPKRHVHLDFHTGPDIPDVGSDFDATQFAETFAAASVDAVTVFAKCHHGHLYFDTDHPARHPGLRPGLDLLGEQIEALHTAGIRAPIYLSVQCDEYAANTHPEWLALEPDLRQVKRGSASAIEPGWQILDLSSPYQDYLADQLDRVLRQYSPVDGVFLDMCWDQPSLSRWALDSMRKRGLDPGDADDRARHARLVAREYMTRYRDMIRNAAGGRNASIFFNSRPRTLAPDERALMTHMEVEALPTGGSGYSYTPYIGRFIRALGLPGLGMTGRFHTDWGDNASLKPAAALKYECCQLFALGFGVSTGDLLHPRAATHPAIYALIGDVYRHIAACERFTDGARSLTEVALLVDPDRGPGIDKTTAIDNSAIGAIRALQQLRQQFDVVLPDADFRDYRVVIVPESTVVTDATVASLLRYLDNGGSLVLVGPAGFTATGEPLLPDQGITTDGPSPYSHTFLRPGDALPRSTTPFDTVMYERGIRIRPHHGATTLVDIVEPYFERSWDHFSGHSYTPPDRSSKYAAIVQNGRVVTIAVPLLDAFARHANTYYRELFGDILDRLLPDPLIRAGGPAHLETSVQVRDNTTIVHLLSYLPSRQGNLDLVTDPFPLVDTPVAIRSATPPTSVTLQPTGQQVAFDYRDGYVHTAVTVLDGHALLVMS